VTRRPRAPQRGQALPEAAILAGLLGMAALAAGWAFQGAWEEAASLLLAGIALPIP
jgi:hypothetical protein